MLYRLECPRGDHAREAWGTPRIESCPACGSSLRPRTTLELDWAPPDMRMSELGVAPREMLAVRGDGGMTIVELA